MQHIQVLTKYWVIRISSNVVLQPCISGLLNWIDFIINLGCVQILAHWISIQITQRFTFDAWLFLKSYVSETLFLLLLALGFFFLLCFLHHELSSTSLCSLQHWHNALKSLGSYGTLMEKYIMCPLDQLLSYWWQNMLKLLQEKILCGCADPSWWISAVLGIA